MSVHDYLLDTAGLDWARLLSAWAWLLPPEVSPWIMNRFGDVFLTSEDGSIHVLELGGGTVEKLADDRDSFCHTLDQGDNANQWLMIPLVDRLVVAGLRLGPGECYGYKQSPVLGGAYSVENTAVVSVEEHVRYNGVLHEQLRDVPDGGRVRIEFTD